MRTEAERDVVAGRSFDIDRVGVGERVRVAVGDQAAGEDALAGPHRHAAHGGVGGRQPATALSTIVK